MLQEESCLTLVPRSGFIHDGFENTFWIGFSSCIVASNEKHHQRGSLTKFGFRGKFETTMRSL